MRERLETLAGTFGVDVTGFAVMSMAHSKSSAILILREPSKY